MNNDEQDEFIKGLTPQEATEIIGLTPEMITAVKAKLAPLNKHDGDCYFNHFKGTNRKTDK